MLGYFFIFIKIYIIIIIENKERDVIFMIRGNNDWLLEVTETKKDEEYAEFMDEIQRLKEYMEEEVLVDGIC